MKRERAPDFYDCESIARNQVVASSNLTVNWIFESLVRPIIFTQRKSTNCNWWISSVENKFL